MNNKFLKIYIDKKAHELASSEDVPIIFKSYKDLNANEEHYKNGAIGKFIYLPKSIGINRRIELAEEYYSVWVLLHELGHYFIYKQDKEQTEEEADYFIKEFFDNYLPPFFKWVFQIELMSRSECEVKFTNVECYSYFKECQKFLKENNQL